MADIYLHSDWHWKHHNIYKFTYKATDGTERRVRERFETCEEGDAYIEQAIRDTVKDGDHLWFLGDMCMWENNHNAHLFVDFMKSLPGMKRLLLGNHDKLKIKHYGEAGFQKIRATNLLDGVLMSHYPIHQAHLGFRAVGNAHGHIHQNPSPAGPYFNCSVEAINYRPVAFEEVRDKLRRLKESSTVQFDVGGNMINGG